MSRPFRARAVLGALTVCCLMLPVLSGCALWNKMFHRQNKDAGCREKPFAQNTDTRPPLRVPAGLSAPDARNAIKIPDLPSPERVRAQTEPCLSTPPSYFSQPLPTELPPTPKDSKHSKRSVPPTAPPPSTPASSPAATPPAVPETSPQTAPAAPPSSSDSSK